MMRRTLVRFRCDCVPVWVEVHGLTGAPVAVEGRRDSSNFKVPELDGARLGSRDDELLGPVQGNALDAALVARQGQKGLRFAHQPNVDLREETGDGGWMGWGAT